MNHHGNYGKSPVGVLPILVVGLSLLTAAGCRYPIRQIEEIGVEADLNEEYARLQVQNDWPHTVHITITLDSDTNVRVESSLSVGQSKIYDLVPGEYRFTAESTRHNTIPPQTRRWKGHFTVESDTSYRWAMYETFK